jgi:tRNA (guanine37-N1)-methyltransferase
MRQIDVFTLFPEAFGWFEGQRHVANAGAKGLELRYVSYRDHTPLTGGQVDDTPFGGGAGMIMMPEPLFAAVEAVVPPRPLYLLAAAGRPFDQDAAAELAAGGGF